MKKLIAAVVSIVLIVVVSFGAGRASAPSIDDYVQQTQIERQARLAAEADH